MARVVILGAGLTGLSTAYHLEQNNFFDFKIFEKEKIHGGLVRSVTHEGFTFDFTGHLLHCNNNYFQSMLDTILPEEAHYKIARKSFVYSHGKFVPYPFQQNLFNLPTEVIAECICGFAKRKHQVTNPQNFREWVLKYFGPGLAKHFFFPYNSKLLCTTPSQIHPSWTGRFVPKVTIGDMFDGLAEENKRKNVGYNHHFIYPKQGGIQTFTDGLRALVASPIHTEYRAIHIDIRKKQVLFENGHVEPYEQLITTIPLNIFLSITKEPANLNIKAQKSKLRCNSVANFNIGFKKQSLPKKHWIYIPEKAYPFYRVGFWHNIAPSLAPPKYGSLYGEIAFLPGKTTRCDLEKVIDLSRTQVCDIFKIRPAHIKTEKVLFLPYAYVIYDRWREQNLTQLRALLTTESIHSIGRYGAWKYSSMQEAMLDGKHMAETIVQGDLFIPAMVTRISKINKEKEAILNKEMFKEKRL